MINRLLWILKGIYRGKFKNILTVTSITIGVLSVVLIGNISSSATEVINQNLDTLGSNSVMISSSADNEEYNFTKEDMDIILEDDRVSGIMPVMIEAADVAISGSAQSVWIWGATDQGNQVVPLDVMYGRNITQADLTSNNYVCMVDNEYANKMYKRENIIGKKLRIECNNTSQELEVVGIVESNSNVVQNVVGGYVSDFVYIPYTTAMQMTSTNNFQQIGIEIKEGYDAEKVAQNLVINAKQKTEEQFLENYKVTNIAQQKQQIENATGIISLVLALIAGISLVVASLSIMTVMLVSVKERKNEIEIKKSIGASKRDIFFEFLAEAMLIALIGCIIGVALGILLPYLVSLFLDISLVINFRVVFLAVAFAILSALIFGVYPAMKAAKMNPVDALRRE